jgi:phosphoribosylglycinamide formyltransferase 1
MINVAIFASGEGTNAENLIRYFSASKEVRIRNIITNNPQAGVVGRAGRLHKNVHLVSKDALNNYTEQLIDFLRTEQTDLIVLAGFLLKLPQKIVEAFAHRIVNIHPALLPAHGGKGMYGAKVHEAVLAAGDAVSGITVHYVDEEYDNGEHILQALCRVEANDTAETLARKIRELEHYYFPKAVEKAIDNFKVNN